MINYLEKTHKYIVINVWKMEINFNYISNVFLKFNFNQFLILIFKIIKKMNF